MFVELNELLQAQVSTCTCKQLQLQVSVFTCVCNANEQEQVQVSKFTGVNACIHNMEVKVMPESLIL